MAAPSKLWAGESAPRSEPLKRPRRLHVNAPAGFLYVAVDGDRSHAGWLVATWLKLLVYERACEGRGSTGTVWMLKMYIPGLINALRFLPSSQRTENTPKTTWRHLLRQDARAMTRCLLIIMLMRRPFVLSSSMAGMHSSTSGALRRGPLCFTMCGGAVWGTVEFFLRSLLRVAFRLPLSHATRWRGRTDRSQYTSYNRLFSGRNGALTAPPAPLSTLTSQPPINPWIVGWHTRREGTKGLPAKAASIGRWCTGGADGPTQPSLSLGPPSSISGGRGFSTPLTAMSRLDLLVWIIDPRP